MVGATDGLPYVAARPLESDRIVFGAPPNFDPLPYLDHKTAAMYEHPEQHHRQDPEEPPRVSIRATADEKLRLYRKMADCGRLSFLREEEVDASFASGLFGVVKDMARDRLIMDSRPANGREQGLNHWCGCLANAALLGGIELETSEELRLSGQDIKDFFYQFVIGHSRACRNALVGKLTAAEARFIFKDLDHIPPEGGYAGLNTMAMGDLCAVEFAQAAHISVMLACQALRPSELLRGKSVMPRGPFMLGLVIDDLVMLERVVKGCSETIADRRMPLAVAKYAEVGLPTNPSKAFVNVTSARFWGAEVDGKAGIVRANSFRLWPLVLITIRICCLGVVSLSLLESLSGSWIAIFLFRRRCLAAMNEIFEVLHSGLAGSDVVRLSSSLRDELFCLAVLGTLSYVNLRATTLPTFRATDASDWGMAAVSADLPVSIAREVSRFSLSRSLWSKLLPPGKAWLKQKGMLDFTDELPGEEHYDVHPLWEMMARCLEFHEEWRRPHQRKVHINIAELQAHLLEEEKLCRKHQSFRCLYGLDSQVSLGALVKGRAASKGLNRVLMRSLATSLGADCYGAYGFLPSALNRADDPTRDKEVGGPDQELPYWWRP